MLGATNKITALYCRLSQEDERTDESLSIENQRMMLETYAHQNHFTNISCFVDDGYSGVDFQRPGFQKMLEAIESDQVSTVIVKDACVIIEPTRKGSFERLSWLGSICF